MHRIPPFPPSIGAVLLMRARIHFMGEDGRSEEGLRQAVNPSLDKKAELYADNVYLCVQIVRGVSRQELYPDSLSIAYIPTRIYGCA